MKRKAVWFLSTLPLSSTFKKPKPQRGVPKVPGKPRLFLQLPISDFPPTYKNLFLSVPAEIFPEVDPLYSCQAAKARGQYLQSCPYL